ncbi:hypothetical protein L1987_25920 [Smallanthus sonchifolius]|uniref:Uncharacterized protein n=1 Tax=Smallanthus sonchifolius TaxID=185202 RepID=A0ACB9IA05_9ASTR|nr:hypothetical protein L1987_25920 [Smallanthus sonchifolius]
MLRKPNSKPSRGGGELVCAIEHKEKTGTRTMAISTIKVQLDIPSSCMLVKLCELRCKKDELLNIKLGS